MLVRLLVALGVLATVAALPAAAEAPSTRVILSYVPVMSNWGPPSANGVVLVSYAEGDVRADLVGLPVLGADQRYELWLFNSGSKESYPLARFNAAPSGATTYVDQLLPDAIPQHGWDYVLVTVESEPGAAHAPGAQRAIVGSIPGTPAESQQFPPSLPQTGAPTDPIDRSGGALLVIETSGLALTAVAVRRRGRLRRRALAQEVSQP